MQVEAVLLPIRAANPKRPIKSRYAWAQAPVGVLLRDYLDLASVSKQRKENEEDEFDVFFDVESPVFGKADEIVSRQDEKKLIEDVVQFPSGTDEDRAQRLNVPTPVPFGHFSSGVSKVVLAEPLQLRNRFIENRVNPELSNNDIVYVPQKGPDAVYAHDFTNRYLTHDSASYKFVHKDYDFSLLAVQSSSVFNGLSRENNQTSLKSANHQLFRSKRKHVFCKNAVLAGATDPLEKGILSQAIREHHALIALRCEPVPYVAYLLRKKETAFYWSHAFGQEEPRLDKRETIAALATKAGVVAVGAAVTPAFAPMMLGELVGSQVAQPFFRTAATVGTALLSYFVGSGMGPVVGTVAGASIATLLSKTKLTLPRLRPVDAVLPPNTILPFCPVPRLYMAEEELVVSAFCFRPKAWAPLFCFWTVLAVFPKSKDWDLTKALMSVPGRPNEPTSRDVGQYLQKFDPVALLVYEYPVNMVLRK